MQQRRHQGLRIELPFGALLGDGNRVRDVGQAAVADLSQVCFIGKTVGLANTFNVCRAEVIEFGGERGKTRCSRIGRSRRRLAVGRRKNQGAHGLNVSRRR
jgi:hypothetical protein